MSKRKAPGADGGDSKRARTASPPPPPSAAPPEVVKLASSPAAAPASPVVAKQWDCTECKMDGLGEDELCSKYNKADQHGGTCKNCCTDLKCDIEEEEEETSDDDEEEEEEKLDPTLEKELLMLDGEIWRSVINHGQWLPKEIEFDHELETRTGSRTIRVGISRNDIHDGLKEDHVEAAWCDLPRVYGVLKALELYLDTAATMTITIDGKEVKCRFDPRSIIEEYLGIAHTGHRWRNKTLFNGNMAIEHEVSIERAELCSDTWKHGPNPCNFMCGLFPSIDGEDGGPVTMSIPSFTGVNVGPPKWCPFWNRGELRALPKEYERQWIKDDKVVYNKHDGGSGGYWPHNVDEYRIVLAPHCSWRNPCCCRQCKTKK
jgi:hypothetical protein